MSISTVPESWKKYGAYYENDQMLIESNFALQIGSGLKTFSNTTIIRRMRIIDSNGMQNRTIKIIPLPGEIKDFQVSVTTPSQSSILLNCDSLKDVYLETGEITIPSVQPGSIIDLFIRIHSYKPVLHYEHWFEREIPVKKGSLFFYNKDHLFYDIKAYSTNNSISRKDTTWGRRKVKKWQVNNFIPINTELQESQYNFHNPHVALVLKQIFNMDILNTWEQLTNIYQSAIKPFPSLSYQIGAKIEDITNQFDKDYQKAESALQWVQSNIKLHNNSLERKNINQVIEDGSGNMIEIATILHKIYQYLDFQTDIIITRPYTFGGFDPEFITPDQLLIPVVTIIIDNQNYAAIPYVQDAKLGEYPIDWQKMNGLSLQFKKIVKLPKSTSNHSLEKSNKFHNLSWQPIIFGISGTQAEAIDKWGLRAFHPPQPMAPPSPSP